MPTTDTRPAAAAAAAGRRETPASAADLTQAGRALFYGYIRLVETKPAGARSTHEHEYARGEFAGMCAMLSAVGVGSTGTAVHTTLLDTVRALGPIPGRFAGQANVEFKAYADNAVQHLTAALAVAR